MKRHDNFSKFHELRKEFPFFSYDTYQYHFSGNSLEISFSFNLAGKYFFNPGVSIPYKKNLFFPYDSLSQDALSTLVFHIGLIELISYWKAACPPRVIIKPHKLSPAQINFWRNVYYQGLGEFFFVNSIETSGDEFMEITAENKDDAGTFRAPSTGSCLVPVGGGKDSAVTLGMLNKTAEDWLPFVINPGKTTDEVIYAAGKSRELTIEFHREIHPLLIELNGKGFLNGHTPFSALLAFYSLLAAYLTGRTEIILSNESSANEATIPGTSINHQYSKTFGFERDFREYCRTYLSRDFNYFSLLRPLSELQIARLFAGMPQFLNAFKSCNVGSKTSSWCGKCPKCLFTFIILSPYLAPDKLTGIFGKNLLDDPSLEGTYEELSGIEESKPFECVGTVDEVNLAMAQSVARYRPGEIPYLLRLHMQRNERLSSVDSSAGISPDHFVPEKYLRHLLKELS